MPSISPSDYVYSFPEAIGRTAQNISAILMGERIKFHAGKVSDKNFIRPTLGNMNNNKDSDTLTGGKIGASLTEGTTNPDSSLSWAAKSYLTSSSFNLSDEKNHLKYIDPYNDEFLFNTNQLSSYTSRELVLDQYFHNITYNHSYISMSVFSALLKAEININDDEKNRLMNAKSREEAMDILNIIRSGESDPKRKAFITALSEIGEKNDKTSEKYKSLLAKQNPLIAHVEDAEKALLKNTFQTSMNEYFLVGKAPMLKTRKSEMSSFSELSDHENGIASLKVSYPENNILEDLESILSILEENSTDFIDRGQLPKERTLFKDNLYDYYLEKVEDKDQDGNPISRSSFNIDKIKNDIDLLKKKDTIQTIKEKHSFAVSGVREILMQSFYMEGGLSLSTFVPTEESLDELKNDPSKKAAMEANFNSNLRAGIQKMDSYRINQLGLDEEKLVKIGMSEFNKFFENKEYREMIMQVDSTLMTSIEKSVPPGHIQENIFQKMLIDGMYNSVMNEIGGVEDYKKFLSISGENNELERISISGDIVDIRANVENSSYLTSSNGEYSELYSDAIDMHNLVSMFKKAHDNKLTKGTAEEILENGADFLSSTSKAALVENIDSLFEENKLTEEDLGRDPRTDSSPENLTRDYVSSYNAKHMYNLLYGDTRFDSFMNNLNLYSKKGMKMLSCLEKANSPAVSSQTTTSETRACIQKYMQEEEQERKETEGAMNEPMLAMCGIIAILFFLETLKRAKIEKLRLLDLAGTWEEAKIGAFISSSADPQEKLFREKQVILDKNIINDGVVKKGQLDEYIFRTIKAGHDFQKDLNPFLGPDSEGLYNIINSANLDTLNISTKGQLVDILDDVGLHDSFNTFSKAYSVRIFEDYLGRYTDLRKGKDYLQIFSNFLDKDIVEFNTLTEAAKADKLEEISLLTIDEFLKKTPLSDSEDILIKIEELSDIRKKYSKEFEPFTKNNLGNIDFINPPFDFTVATYIYQDMKKVEDVDLSASYQKYEKLLSPNAILPSTKEEFNKFFSGEMELSDGSDDFKENFIGFVSVGMVDLFELEKSAIKRRNKTPQNLESNEMVDVILKTSRNLQEVINKIELHIESTDLSDGQVLYLKSIVEKLKIKTNSADKKKQHEIMFNSFLKSPVGGLLELEENKFQEFCENLEKGVKEGGIPPSKLASVVFKMEDAFNKNILSLSSLEKDVEKINETLKIKSELLEKKISIAPKEDVPRLKEELKNLDITLREIIRSKERELRRAVEIKLSHGEPIMRLNSLLEDMLRGALNSGFAENNENKEAIKKFFKESEISGRYSPDSLEELIDPLFSQGVCFSGKKDDSDGLASFKARYSSELADASILQDLRMLDEYNKMIHSSYDANGLKVKSPVPRKNKQISEAIAAMKSSLLEAYINSKIIEDSSLNRNDVLENLYNNNREGMIDTAHMFFGFNNQEDGENVQVIVVDKTENQKNIEESLKAMQEACGHIDENELQEIYMNIDNEYNDEISKIPPREIIYPEDSEETIENKKRINISRDEIEKARENRKEEVKNSFKFSAKNSGKAYLEYFAGISATGTRYLNGDARNIKNKLDLTKNVKLRGRHIGETPWNKKSILGKGLSFLLGEKSIEDLTKNPFSSSLSEETSTRRKELDSQGNKR